MDPFSITAGVAGLLSLTIQLRQTLSTYISSVKHVSSESRELAAELTGLVAVLGQLERFIERQAHHGNKFEESSVIYGTTLACHTRLSTIKATLDGFILSTDSRSKRWLRNIKWPFQKEEHRKTIDTLHDCVNIFQTSLSIDGWHLVAETAKDSALIYGRSIDQAAEISRVFTAIQKTNDDLQSYDSRLKALRQAQSNSRKEALLDWISSDVNPSINFNNAIKGRQPETGLWFLESSTFAQWTHKSSLLWLIGIPGCGKTILCSTIIEAVKEICFQSHNDRLAYFYFDFQNNRTQSAEAMLRSLIRQISATVDEIPATLQALHASYRYKGHSPSLDELISTLKSIVRDTPKRTFVILDALDEVPEGTGILQRQEILDVLRHLVEQHLPNLHLMCTSRDEIDIREALHDISSDHVRLEQAEVDADIRLYVRSCLTHPRLVNLPTSLKEDIERQVVDGARGMFRWAVCQIDTIKTCRKARDIKEALKDLPPTLDATYERMLSLIDKRDREVAFSILQWVAFSREPMTAAEIAEAAVTRPHKFDCADRLIQITEILRICHSLITLSAQGPGFAGSEEDQIVRFTHFSVQEYLMSQRCKQFSISVASQSYIAGSCVAYLVHIDRSGEDGTEYPLFQYATTYWYEHTRDARTLEQSTLDILYDLFEPASFTKRPKAWVPTYDPVTNLTDIQLISPFPGPLFFTARLNLLDTTCKLLEGGVPVNEVHQYVTIPGLGIQESWGAHQLSFCTALEAAACVGHIDAVQLLLSHDADCNGPSAHGSILRRTLECHAENAGTGTYEIVRLMLHHGAKDNPLQLAAEAALATVRTIVGTIYHLSSRVQSIDSRQGRRYRSRSIVVRPTVVL